MIISREAEGVRENYIGIEEVGPGLVPATREPERRDHDVDGGVHGAFDHGARHRRQCRTCVFRTRSTNIHSNQTRYIPRLCPVTTTFLTPVLARLAWTPARRPSAVRSKVCWNPLWTCTPSKATVSESSKGRGRDLNVLPAACGNRVEFIFSSPNSASFKIERLSESPLVRTR